MALGCTGPVSQLGTGHCGYWGESVFLTGLLQLGDCVGELLDGWWRAVVGAKTWGTRSWSERPTSEDEEGCGVISRRAGSAARGHPASSCGHRDGRVMDLAPARRPDPQGLKRNMRFDSGAIAGEARFMAMGGDVEATQHQPLRAATWTFTPRVRADDYTRAAVRSTAAHQPERPVAPSLGY